MVFSLRKVAFHYAELASTASDSLIHGVDVDYLDIRESGVTVVVGPSGSGKSTFLSILAGFIQPEIGPEGYLRFAGKDMGTEGHPPGRVAFVFQSAMLLSAGSGVVNILQGQVAAGKRRGRRLLTTKDMRYALHSLGLFDGKKLLVAKRSRQLSGGEAQRIAILRALLTDPDAILCDEPTSSLDEANAKRSLETLTEWARTRGRPVLWVTHKLEQAAQYADHYIFLSGGRIYRPEQDVMRRLQSADYETRLECLREVAGHLAGEATDGPPASDGADDETLHIGRLRYNRWIANALSMDVRADRELGKAALAPRSVQRLLARLDPMYRAPIGWTRRLWRQITSYSRYSLGIILSVLLVQVCFAFFLGRMAEQWSADRLEDPAVARIVFEYVSGEQGLLHSVEPEQLSLPVLQDLRDELRRRLATSLGPFDQDLVRVFGRRAIDRSRVTFQVENERCQEGVTLETVALDVDDPLVLQIDLDPANGALLGDIKDAVAQSREARLMGTGDAIALLQRGIVEAVRDQCGFEPDDEIEAGWVAGYNNSEAMEIEIAGAITESPPLYPNVADMIVFEHDYQMAVNVQDVQPDPFFIATAYFPIEGFAVARAVLAERGYRIRDDSAAAVMTVRDVARIANVVPWIIIAVNVIAAFTVVYVFVASLFELHRRVLALFCAHGFRFWDALTIMGLHLWPAVVVSLGLLLAFVVLLSVSFSFGLGDHLLAGFDPIPPLLHAVLISVALTIFAGAIAVTYIVKKSWDGIGRHLKELLQD